MAGATLGATAVFATSAQAATYTVTGTGDATGSCTGLSCPTLRDAVTATNTSGVAGTPDTIDLTGLTGTIALTQGKITITDPGGVNIDGPGAGTLTVSGGGTSGIFDINPPATPAPSVSISGLTLTDGTTSSAGGAVDDQRGPLTLTNDTISGNTASSSGGGVYASDPLTVSGSTITGNTSTALFGGGIESKYRATITNSTISGNTASVGGGIDSLGDLSVTGSQITSNQASGQGGGGIGQEFGSLSLTGSTVSGNSASGNAGGGVFDASEYGTTINSSTISGNTAVRGGGLDLRGYDFGNSPGSNPVIVENSTITQNQAGGGAGIEIGEDVATTPITVESSTLSANQGSSNSFGGGLLISGSVDAPFDLVDSTISGNTATDGGGVSLGYSGSTTPVLGSGGSIGFDNSTIDGNGAGTYGGGIYLGEYSTGSPATEQSATAAINSTVVAGDTAGGSANDLFRPSTSTSGGFNDTFSLIETPGNAPLLSSQSLITGTDPQLGALGNNGGPTQTMLPSNTSPVIDQGHAQAGLSSDQRGDPRSVDNGKTKPPGGDGTDIGAVELARIPAPPPPQPPPPTPLLSIGATIGPAGSITPSSAVLNGTITTNGHPVTWYFQYGTSTAYGGQTPPQSIAAGQGHIAGAAQDPTSVSFKVTGLKRGTRYHYRLVATTPGLTVLTVDATFKTLEPTINVTPSAVRANRKVRVFGSAGACTRGDRVTLISGVFSRAHRFAGVNAVYAKVGSGSRYSVVTRIPAGRNPGRYLITARCGGGNLGVRAFLRVLPTPVPKFTG